MNYSCPKCNTQIETAAADIPVEGLFSKCPECSSSIVVAKESFAKRALHKSDDISCAECGSHPGTAIYCQNCHAIYPDFLVVKTSSAAQKQLGKILASFNILKNIKFNIPARTHSAGSFGATPAVSGKRKGLSLPGQPAQLAAVLAAVVILIGGGGFFWYQEKTEKEYTDNFVKALLVIKSARDAELKISTRLADGLKTGTAAGLTPAEQKFAAAAKNDTELIIKRISKVPGKFVASNETLKKLQESHLKLHSTVTSPARDAAAYSAAVSKMNDEFMANARQLKSGLPERISDKLAENKKKYKPLQDF